MTDKKIEEIINESDLVFTKNPFTAIWLLRNGKMIDGDIRNGIRGESHVSAEILIKKSRYENTFWHDLHTQTGLVRLLPETKEAMIVDKQELTYLQREIINKVKYAVIPYC